MCFRFLESMSQVTASIGSSINAWRTKSIRHGSPQSSENLTTTYTIIPGVMLDGLLHHWEPEGLSGIKLLNVGQQTLEHVRLSSFMDEIMIFRSQIPFFGISGGASKLVLHHVLFYESVSIPEQCLSESLAFIVSHCTVTLNKRIHSLMKHSHPHLLGVFLNLHQDETWNSNKASQSSRSNRYFSRSQ